MNAMKRQYGFSVVKLAATLVVAAALAVGLWMVLRADTAGLGGSGLDGRFNYDLSKVRRTDPALVGYEQAALFDTGLADARAIAVRPEGNRIYVAGADRGGRGAIRVLDSDGNVVAAIETDGQPRCLALAGDRIYVGMKDHVQVLDGALRTRWKPPGGSPVLTSIAVAGQDVFVADAGNRMVRRYDLAGRPTGSIDGKAGRPEETGFLLPSPHFDLAIAPDGRLRVANSGRHRIETWTFDGHLEGAWGRFGVDIEGFCGCCNPANFALLPDGSFVTAEKGLPRVKVYDAEGRFRSVVVGADAFPAEYACINRGTEACPAGAMDVATDQAGRIYVLEPHEKTVRVFVKKVAAKP